MKLKQFLLLVALLFASQSVMAQQATATISDVSTYLNSTNGDDENGVYIEVNFTVSNMLNKKGACTAFFYYEDGTALKDFNKRYYTASGKVAVTESFTAPYATTEFEEFGLFIPYTELHLGDSSSDVKFFVAIFDQYNKQIATSEYVEFNVSEQ